MGYFLSCGDPPWYLLLTVRTVRVSFVLLHPTALPDRSDTIPRTGGNPGGKRVCELENLQWLLKIASQLFFFLVCWFYTDDFSKTSSQIHFGLLPQLALIHSFSRRKRQALIRQLLPNSWLLQESLDFISIMREFTVLSCI